MATNFLGKFMDSIGKVFIGFILFLISFVVLFYVEGRTDYSIIAKQAISADSATENELVFNTGELISEELIGDDYLLPGNYVVLKREAEIYAWKEIEETDEDDRKTYTYETEWVTKPQDSAQFFNPIGHDNYPLEIEQVTHIASNVFVGEYSIDSQKIRWPSTSNLSINEDIAILQENQIVDSNYIFMGQGTVKKPIVGDVRISFKSIQPGKKSTVFGRVDAKNIEPHHGKEEKALYRLFWGTTDDAFSLLKQEYETAGWIGRIGGFLLMWVGLLLVFGPLTLIFQAIPIVGKLGKSAIAGATFIVALVLTTITSLLSMVLHNPFGIAIIVIGIAAGIYFFFIKKQQDLAKNKVNEPLHKGSKEVDNKMNDILNKQAKGTDDTKTDSDSVDNKR